jgi:hypothetical protein
MATTIPSTALVPVTPVFTNTERLALAGFLAGYSGLTRQAYELDLRQFASWCQVRRLQAEIILLRISLPQLAETVFRHGAPP